MNFWKNFAWHLKHLVPHVMLLGLMFYLGQGVQMTSYHDSGAIYFVALPL